MEIASPRFKIRPFVELDRPRMLELLTSDTFMQFSHKGVLTMDEANLRFDRLVSNTKGMTGKHALVCNSENVILGYCGIERFDLNGVQEYELGYRVADQWRGKGIATEACKTLLSEIASNIKDVYALVEPENQASIKVLEKAGFTAVGQHQYMGLDCLLYKLNA